jgi:hypothetical protein
VYRLLVGKPEGKRPLGRPRHRWIYNLKMGLLQTGLGDVDWIGLAQDKYRWKAFVKAVITSGCTTCVLSSGTQLHRVS